jgi:hypothetical protein
MNGPGLPNRPGPVQHPNSKWPAKNKKESVGRSSRLKKGAKEGKDSSNSASSSSQSKKPEDKGKKVLNKVEKGKATGSGGGGDVSATQEQKKEEGADEKE